MLYGLPAPPPARDYLCDIIVGSRLLAGDDRWPDPAKYAGRVVGKPHESAIGRKLQFAFDDEANAMGFAHQAEYLIAEVQRVHPTTDLRYVIELRCRVSGLGAPLPVRG